MVKKDPIFPHYFLNQEKKSQFQVKLKNTIDFITLNYLNLMKKVKFMMYFKVC